MIAERSSVPSLPTAAGAGANGLPFLGLALSAALLSSGARPALAGAPPLTVKYRSASNVYVEGGRAQGLAVGDRLLVVSGGETVAELEVLFLAELSASCRVVSEKRTVRAGDRVVPASVAAPTAGTPPEPRPPADTLPSSPSPPLTAIAPTPRPARPWARMRGGISFGYYRVWDDTPSALDFEQRTARFDLTVWDVGGQPYTFNLRFRSRQDVRARALSVRTPKEDREDRLYEVSLRYEPPSDRFAFEAGRIGTSRFAGIGYLDGVLGRVQVAPHLHLGGFFGRRADVDALGFEGSGQKYGAFLRIAPDGRYAAASYEALFAFVREFAGGEISREYVTLESRLGSGRPWSFFERAEVDLNRGWRELVTAAPYQLSNLSLSASLRLSPSATGTLSYDSRKNYRDYRNRDVPEAIFDDLLHQGFRASLFLGRPSGLGVSGSLGVRLREQDAQNTYSFSGGVRHGNLWSQDLSVGADAAGFANVYTDGLLLSARAGKRFAGGHYLDLSYGNSLYRVKATGDRRGTQWLRLTGHRELPRRLYLQADLEYDTGDDLKGPRAFLELGCQF